MSGTCDQIELVKHSKTEILIAFDNLVIFSRQSLE